MDQYLSKVLVNGYVSNQCYCQHGSRGLLVRHRSGMQPVFRDLLQRRSQELLWRRNRIAVLGAKAIETFPICEDPGNACKQRPRLKCVWTLANQRKLESMTNWQSRNLNEFDDFRPIFEVFCATSRLSWKKRPRIRKNTCKSTWPKWPATCSTTSSSAPNFHRKALKRLNKRVQWIASTLFNRIMLYCNSIEFTHGNCDS